MCRVSLARLDQWTKFGIIVAKSLIENYGHTSLIGSNGEMEYFLKRVGGKFEVFCYWIDLSVEDSKDDKDGL